MILRSVSARRQSWTVENIIICTDGGNYILGDLYFTGISYHTGAPTDGKHFEKRFRAKLEDNGKFKVSIGTSGTKILFNTSVLA